MWAPPKNPEQSQQNNLQLPHIFQHHPAPNPTGACPLPRARQLLLQPGRAWDAAVISSEAMLPGATVENGLNPKKKKHGWIDNESMP